MEPDLRFHAALSKARLKAAQFKSSPEVKSLNLNVYYYKWFKNRKKEQILGILLF